jgi:hypothetical protein
MKRDIGQRLEKLESRLPRRPTQEEKRSALFDRFLVYAIAFYLGDPTPEESVMEAYLRALAYRPGSVKLCTPEPPSADYGERVRQAKIKLLAKFGVSWEHDWDAIIDAFELMEAGFSEGYKKIWRDTCADSRG